MDTAVLIILKSTNAVEDGPWKRHYQGNLALMELMTDGKTSMMLVQTQYYLVNMNVDRALGNCTDIQGRG